MVVLLFKSDYGHLCPTFYNFSVYSPKSPFLPSLSPIHTNTRVEGVHVLKPSIYLGFRGLSLFAHAFLGNDTQSSDRDSKLENHLILP
jgi:hypothetical protein